MTRLWKIANREGNDIVRHLLRTRGVADDGHAAFLSPVWERDTFGPHLFTRMPEAVALMFNALQACA